MPIDPLLTELMNDEILIETVYAVPGRPTLDGYGRHVTGGQYKWGPPVTYKCHIEYKAHIVTDTDARDRFASGVAYLDAYYPKITTEDLLTIPSQVQPAMRNPTLLQVESFYDENGGYNTVLHFD